MPCLRAGYSDAPSNLGTTEWAGAFRSSVVGMAPRDSSGVSDAQITLGGARSWIGRINDMNVESHPASPVGGLRLTELETRYATGIKYWAQETGLRYITRRRPGNGKDDASHCICVISTGWE